MHGSGSGQHPPAQPMLRWVLDVLVIVPVVLFSLAYLVHDRPQPAWLAVAVIVALSAPLLVRRAWPSAVFGWLFVISAAAGLWNVRLVASLALVVALYTVTSQQSRRRALVAAGLLEVGVITAAIRLNGIAVAADGAWWHAAIMGSGLVAAALGLGLYVATRQAYLTQLRDRAERLELERDQQNELAAGAERARITNEMHDILAHHLSVIIALSDGAAATAGSSPATAAGVMRTVSATGRLALADIRQLLAGPSQPGSEGAPIAPVPGLGSLDALVARVRAAGLPVSYRLQGEPSEVSPGVELTVYRLVQEALTNTLKHAGAQASAVVTIRYQPGEVKVDVEDDGVGGQGAPVDGAGRGLVGMRQRVEAFGGEVHAGPRSPVGWCVWATLRGESVPDKPTDKPTDKPMATSAEPAQMDEPAGVLMSRSARSPAAT